MVTYNCKRCGYTTNLRGNIKRHFLKKKTCRAVAEPCDIKTCFEEQLGEKYPLTLNYAEKTNEMNEFTLNYAENQSNNTRNFVTETPAEYRIEDKTPTSNHNIKCEYCNKIFQKKRYLDDHLRRSCLLVKTKIDNSVKPYENEVIELKNELNRERILREKDKEIINELKSQIDVLLKGKGNVYNYNQNIIVQPFGKENTSYIQEDYIDKLVKKGALQCIPELLQHIHFNSEHQENYNVKIPNKKQSFAQVFNGHDWVYKDKRNTIDNMTNKAFGIINRHYSTGSNKYMDEVTDKIESNNKELVKQLQKDTEIMILNHQDKCIIEN